jgi:hypothetical protein
LRRQVLERRPCDRELAFALLVREGMARWLRAWAPAATPSQRGERPRAVARTRLEGVQGEVTRLLVTMALGASREETHR